MVGRIGSKGRRPAFLIILLTVSLFLVSGVNPKRSRLISVVTNPLVRRWQTIVVKKHIQLGGTVCLTITTLSLIGYANMFSTSCSSSFDNASSRGLLGISRPDSSAHVLSPTKCRRNHNHALSPNT